MPVEDIIKNKELPIEEILENKREEIKQYIEKDYSSNIIVDCLSHDR